MVAAVSLAVSLCSCDGPAGVADSGAAQPSSTFAAGPPTNPKRAQLLLRAELQRRGDLVKKHDLSSRFVDVRRAAARALARIKQGGGHKLLLRLLSDPDEQVVTWAAYGLGDQCAGRRDQTVQALVIAAARWLDKQPQQQKPKGKTANASSQLSALSAITRAVGRCGSSRSEATLISWARSRGANAIDAIFALGDLVRQKKIRLREESFVALLELAAGNASNKPIAEALYPLGRAAHLRSSVIERTVEVAKSGLGRAGPARQFAIQALSRTNGSAVEALQQVVVQVGKYSAAERALAARALKELDGGQKALHAALDKLVPNTADPLTVTALVGPDLGATLSVLESITTIGKARPMLRRFAKLPAPPGAPASVIRRLSWLRCRAAQVLVERNYTDPLLVGCDLTVAKSKAQNLSGSIGARVVVAAIGIEGAKIRGKRAAAWRDHAMGKDARARQAAIALIGSHAEIEGAPEVLASALSAAEPGVVATAAEVIAKHPQRARGATKLRRRKRKRKAKPVASAPVHQAVAKALLARLEGKGPTADIEALSAVIDAVGALLLVDAKKPLQSLCRSPHAKIRQQVEKSLALLLGGDGKVGCAAPEGGRAAPAELDKPVNRVTKITFDSDAGELVVELDPRLAPVAVTRIVNLVKSGFYDGMIVHRVVAGFVSQLGSPTADGYGGPANMPPLSCETSPIHYGPLSVGIALAGRDTGSSQFFVTHASYPHLDGRYAQIGTAKGSWEALVDGDRITKARVAE